MRFKSNGASPTELLRSSDVLCRLTSTTSTAMQPEAGHGQWYGDVRTWSPGFGVREKVTTSLQLQQIHTRPEGMDDDSTILEDATQTSSILRTVGVRRVYAAVRYTNQEKIPRRCWRSRPN